MGVGSMRRAVRCIERAMGAASREIVDACDAELRALIGGGEGGRTLLPQLHQCALIERRLRSRG